MEREPTIPTSLKATLSASIASSDCLRLGPISRSRAQSWRDMVSELLATRYMLLAMITMPPRSVAEEGYHAKSSMMKCSMPKHTSCLSLSPSLIAEEGPSWIATPTRACPMVGANCHWDFAVILMIWEFCEGK